MHLEGCKSSGLLTADAVIVGRPCLIHAITLVPAAADSAVVLYDNAASAAGDVLAKVTCITALSDGSKHITFPHPLETLKGAYADVSGASAAYIIYYSLM